MTLLNSLIRASVALATTAALGACGGDTEDRLDVADPAVHSCMPRRTRRPRVDLT